MEETIFVVPAKGMRVQDPDTGQILPEEGVVVSRNFYWLRRLWAGDVTEGKQTKSASIRGENKE